MSKNPAADALRAELAKAQGNGNKGPLVAHSADDLSQVKPLNWVWHNRIVKGYLNLIIGQEGIGKGALVTKLIALLTKGELEGSYFGKPMTVGIIGDEDGFYDVWTPRLYAAGADRTRVWRLEQPDGGYLSLTDDIDRLAEKIQELGIGLLYFDQLLDNLGMHVNSWHDKQVRDALVPARVLGKTLDIAVLAALHPNKHGTTFRDLVAGTAAFNAVSRSSLLLAKDPDDSEKRVLVQGKGNLSKLPAGVAFRISSERTQINLMDFDLPVIESLHESVLTVEDLLAGGNGKEPSLVDMAAALIEEMLPKDNKWHVCTDIYNACVEDGISKPAMSRARERLGVEVSRMNEPNARSQWRWRPS